MLDTRQVSEEVLFTTRDLTTVSLGDIERLKEQATRTRRRRIRLCAHRQTDAPVHEMVIIHAKDAYVPPHKHVGKEESLHLIEGVVNVVLFHEHEASIREVISMGEYASGRTFYYRLAGDVYHTLLIDSEFAVFHEVTSGPFNKADMVVAPWAPQETDPAAVRQFQDRLRQQLGGNR